MFRSKIYADTIEHLNSAKHALDAWNEKIREMDQRDQEYSERIDAIGRALDMLLAGDVHNGSVITLAPTEAHIREVSTLGEIHSPNHIDAEHP